MVGSSECLVTVCNTWSPKTFLGVGGQALLLAVGVVSRASYLAGLGGSPCHTVLVFPSPVMAGRQKSSQSRRKQWETEPRL